LQEFNAHEVRNARLPLPPGPLKPFFAGLCALRGKRRNQVPVGTVLVTDRSASAHERAIRRLIAWGVAVDEALFPGGNALMASYPAIYRSLQPRFFGGCLFECDDSCALGAADFGDRDRPFRRS
jgi:5'-nucleotidase